MVARPCMDTARQIASDGEADGAVKTQWNISEQQLVYLSKIYKLSFEMFPGRHSSSGLLFLCILFLSLLLSVHHSLPPSLCLTLSFPLSLPLSFSSLWPSDSLLLSFLPSLSYLPSLSSLHLFLSSILSLSNSSV
ncbi:unnamed protein product [Gadus morhua 'NCC']